MAKYELTKTIDAIKLNKRTLRPLGPERFYYLGEPYQCPHADIASALQELG